MSAQSILKRKSIKQLKRELAELEAKLATCNGCASLKCEIRETCKDNAGK